MCYMQIELHTCVKNDTCVRNDIYMKNERHIYVKSDPGIDIYEDERHVYVKNDPVIYIFERNTPYERMNHMIWFVD